MYIDGDQWIIEAREGGPDGQVRVWQPPREEDALQLADELMGDSDGWRELADLRRRPGASQS